MIWVSGKPGSGKSALSKHLLDCMVQEQSRRRRQGTINHLQGTEAIISFFFDGRSSELLGSERAFLQALLYQIVEQAPSLSCLVPQQKTDHAGRKVPRSLDSLRESLLLMLSDRKVKSTYLIIDAFDECVGDCKIELLKFVLGDLVKHLSLHILITSRQHLELEVFLGSFPTIRLEDLNSKDIHTYLGSELEVFTRFHSPQFVEKLVRKAERRSEGVFLWVKLVVKALKTGRMFAGTAQELEEELDSLPGNLLAFYDRILRGLDMSVDAEDRRMLEWVLYAERPLTVTEIRYAVSIGSKPPPSNLASVEQKTVRISRMEARIREYSGGLLEVKKGVAPRYKVVGENQLPYFEPEDAYGDLFVQFIHQSVKDFLLKKDSELTTTASPLIPPSKAHSHLARVCITYLAFPDFDRGDFPTQDARKIPFLPYATANWIMHAPLAEQCGETMQMVRFGWPERQNFRVWSENYIRLQEPEYIWSPSEWRDPLLVAARVGLSADLRNFLLPLERGDSRERFRIVSAALIAAAFGGYETTAQVLLENGADVNVEGGMALYTAADGGHEKIVQLLLKRGVHVNSGGGNALEVAAYKGHEKIMQLLLEGGADVHAQGGDFGGALLAAASGGHAKAMRLLFESGVDVNAQGASFEDALQIAVDERHINVLQILLENANVNTQRQSIGNVLQVAAYDGQERIVRLLLEKGADVNTQGGRYGNPLQAAACGRQADIMQIFLEEGAEANSLGGQFGKALQVAAEKGHEKVVQLLLEQCTDTNTQERSIGRSLHAAAREGHEKVVQLLLWKGADPNFQGAGSGNALQSAALMGYEKVVELLLENGADVGANGGSFGDALQSAARNGHEKVVQVLLDNGADPNAPEGPFGKALYVAARGNHLSVVQQLLLRGADANVLGKHFGDAMTEGGHPMVIQLLGELGPCDMRRIDHSFRGV